MKRNSIANSIVLASSLLLSIGILFSSCEKVRGEGPVVTQDRTVQPFKSVSAGVSGRIRYIVSAAYQVQIQAQQNILDIIETVVTGGELIIKFKNGVNLRSHEEIIINISGPSPEGLTISGAASLDVNGVINGDHLNLRVSGSGSINADKAVLTDRLETTISGSGNITVSDGSVKNQQMRISGSGNIHTTGVAGQNVDAEISGSGNIRVKVSDKLVARISGSGSVYYAGTPQVTTTTSGSGSVRPL